MKELVQFEQSKANFPLTSRRFRLAVLATLEARPFGAYAKIVGTGSSFNFCFATS